ncbi:MAG TPA: BF3164 family lipoprotein [Longimicrobium sp.]|nr:BF3164 family lipoprotein [Longimicrobium sp.]
MSRHFARLCTKIGMLCLCASILGCQAEVESGPESAFEEQPSPRILLPNGIVYKSSTLAGPSAVEWMGTQLVVLDPMGDSLVKVFDVASGILERSFGRRGKGPGEFSGAWGFDAPERQKGFIWIYDVQLRRLTRVHLQANPRTGWKLGEHLIHLLSEFTVNSPVFLHDGSIVSPALMSHAGRVARFDSAGTLLGISGPAPPAPQGVPLRVAQHAYQSIARTNPSRTMFVLATRHADQLEIYRSDGALVTIARGRNPFTPTYTVRMSRGQPELATNDELRFGYVGLATTENRIYALYSGKSRAEAPGRANYGSVIRVSDWNGTFRESWSLRQSTLGIAVDSAGRTLYAVRHDPEPAIVAYTIPEEARE